MTAEELKVGNKVKYVDGDETCVAKVIKKDDLKQLVYFIDMDDFEWEEKYNEIPIVVIRILDNF